MTREEFQKACQECESSAYESTRQFRAILLLAKVVFEGVETMKNGLRVQGLNV